MKNLYKNLFSGLKKSQNGALAILGKDADYKIDGRDNLPVVSDDLKAILLRFVQEPSGRTINYSTIDFLNNYINIKFKKL